MAYNGLLEPEIHQDWLLHCMAGMRTRRKPRGTEAAAIGVMFGANGYDAFKTKSTNMIRDSAHRVMWQQYGTDRIAGR